jgi:hypothetical protein
VDAAGVSALKRYAALLAVALVLTPAAASAPPVDAFFNSVIASRVDHTIGFTPTTFVIHPRGQKVVPITVSVGGRRYSYVFGNAAAVVGPPDIYLRNMIDGRRFPSPQGIFLDRKLTPAESRHVRVRLDLGRDADVLVVAREHPACAAGVTRAAAKGIAAGKIRTWAAAGVEGAGAIALRRSGGSADAVEPRFGAGWKLPRGARAAYDGGIGEAASGSLAVAAVTSWSRARAYQAVTCAVPIGGKAPSDATVRGLSHPDAYPISFVTLRQLKTAAPVTAAFVKYLGSPRATAELRKRGMLLAGRPWPAVPAPQSG